MLSQTEHRAFESIRRSLTADPHVAAASRSADVRVWRYRLWTWLAPTVVARRRARYVRRLAEGC